MSNVQIAREVVNFADRNSLKSSTNRRKFSMDLCSALNFWSVEEMNHFVEEMRGLNFSSQSDRQLFLQFLDAWLHLEGDR